MKMFRPEDREAQEVYDILVPVPREERDEEEEDRRVSAGLLIFLACYLFVIALFIRFFPPSPAAQFELCIIRDVSEPTVGPYDNPDQCYAAGRSQPNLVNCQRAQQPR